MAEEPIRLGGMALTNGVLVHGPTSWGCAVRRADGTIEVAAERKRFVSDERTPPLLRGPLKLLEAMAVLPSVRRALPSARLPFERPAVLAAKAPAHVRPLARVGATLASLAVSTEIFSWMVRNPEHPLSKALAKPGHELQHRLATAEPTPEQLEVAEAALAACLELEDGHRN